MAKDHNHINTIEMKLIIEKLEDIIEWRKINCSEDIDIEDVILSVNEVKTIIRMYEQTERMQELVKWLNVVSED